MTDALNQHTAITGFARRAGGHGSIRGNASRIHDASEFAERRGGIAQCLAIEFSGSKYGVTEAHRRAHGLHDLPFVRGTDARNHQPERVGAGVNRRELDGFAKS
jgi:hypothetical protein